MPSHRLNPIADELYERIRSAKSEVVLVSPFIKDEVLHRCLEASQASVHCRVLTSLRLDYYLAGALDIQTIRSHIDSPSFSAYSVQRLHAKVFVIDESFCYIGSNNLTNNGLYGNVEMGVVVEHEAEVASIKLSVNSILDNGTSVQIGHELLDELAKIERPIKSRKSKASDETVEPLTQVQLTQIATQLGGWTGLALSILLEHFSGEFSLADFYAFEPYFKTFYPNNNTIQAKLRRQLQILRDFGLVTFLGSGRYAVNW